MADRDPTQERLRQLFMYEEETGRILHNNPKYPARKGKEAGREHRRGGRDVQYRKVKVDGREVFSHRVAWILNNGDIPEGMTLNHKDHDGMNNRLDNLELVTPDQHQLDRPLSKSNTSSCNGVSWYRPYGKWVAKISVNGERIHLGYFDDFEEAVEARKEAERDFGFSENHGKPKTEQRLAREVTSG